MKIRVLAALGVLCHALGGHSQGALPSAGFGNNGLALVNFIDTPQDLLITDTDAMPDGGLVMTGSYIVGDTARMFAQRFGDDGQLVESFATGGRFFSPAEYGSIICRQTAVRADGSMLLVGVRNVSGSHKLHALQIDPNGQIDADFGDNGFAALEATEAISVGDIALENDGAAFITGYIGAYAFVVRILADGTHDTSFGTDGIALIASPTGHAIIGSGIAIAPTGYLIISGPRNESQCSGSFVAALDMGGNPVPWFGNDGFLEMDLYSSGVEMLKDMLVKPDGAIILTGIRYGNGIPNTDLFVALRPDGSADPGFGTQGVVEWACAPNTNHNSVEPHLLPDGDLLFTGSQQSSSGLLCNLFILRMNPDGAMATGFGTAGAYYYHPPGHTFQFAHMGAQLLDGRVAIAGYCSIGSGFGYGAQVFDIQDLTTAIPAPLAEDKTSTVFPNPSSGHITLRNWELGTDHTVRLIDQSGRLAQQWTLLSSDEAQDVHLELAPSLINGNYIVTGGSEAAVQLIR